MVVTAEDIQRIDTVGQAAAVLLARQDFAEYCRCVHNVSLYPHQRVWARELQQPDSPHVLIIAPPETFKSSTVRMFIEWRIGLDPDICILLVMNTAGQAQKQVMSIAETISHNPRYHQLFPGISPHPARGWSHEMLFVGRRNEARPDPTLYGTGIDGPYQGSHVDILIVDDPTDQQDVVSSAIMEAQRQRVRGVLLDRLVEGGKFFAILTRWGEADLVRDFKEMGFSMTENPIEGHYPWGRLLCPEVFPDDRLRLLRGQKGGALYQLTYLCNPAAAEGAILKRAWWRRYGEAPPLGTRFQSWDLSTGKSELGDYTAWGVWGVGEDGYYVLDAGRERLSMDGVIRKMQLLYEAETGSRRAKAILVEAVGTSIPVVESLQQHTRLPLQEIKPGNRDKVSRVQGIAHLIEAGRVWLPSAAPWVEAFVDECSAFPGGRYNDQVDMMSQALGWCEKRGGIAALGAVGPTRGATRPKQW